VSVAFCLEFRFLRDPEPPEGGNSERKQNASLRGALQPANGRLIIIAFMKPDVFWSLFAMPIGLTICFAPAVIVWLLCGSKTPCGDCCEKSEKKD
jgi:hypothetical protein